MKILQVNTVYSNGSTGKIVKALCSACNDNGMECIAAVRHVENDEKKTNGVLEISGSFNSRIHGKLAQMTMFKGCFSYFKTRRFLRTVKKFDPDIIHLHNLHGSFVNISLLMDFIKKNKTAAIFTLHDCWAFTAICAHFSEVGCDRWKSGCGKCPQKSIYSSSLLDSTARVWELKKKWFTGIDRAIVVTPSQWLAEKTRESFLRDYPVRIIYNGIDLNVFRPTASSFRHRYGLENKKIVLGVAFVWGYGKGLDVMISLAERLHDEYCVVLVGTDENTEKLLPQNIISIQRTGSQRELAEIYSAADVFANPTREEVLGLTNIEALACGTPVVTFAAGGSPECIDEDCGVAVAIDDVGGMEREVVRICTEHPYSQENCVRRAKKFSNHDCFKEYIKLYKEIEGGV